MGSTLNQGKRKDPQPQCVHSKKLGGMKKEETMTMEAVGKKGKMGGGDLTNQKSYFIISSQRGGYQHSIGVTGGGGEKDFGM